MLKISVRSVKTTPSYCLDPWKLKLGDHFAPNMFVSSFKGRWGDAKIQPVSNFSLHPASVVLHYSQTIFEGLKVYRTAGGELQLFRPELNANRMRQSARRLVLPEFEEADFLQAIDSVVKANEAFVPVEPGFLYLRPAMIGTDICIGPQAGKEALFFIIALPGGPVFGDPDSLVGQINVMISLDVARAARGGTGAVKAGANYANTLLTVREAQSAGCSQVLFLDPVEGRYLEELGGSSLFLSDGEKLITPKLTSSILDGVTRKSIIEIAHKHGILVEERAIELKELTDSVLTGVWSEGFVCGTAAAVTAINSLRMNHGAELIKLKTAPGPMTSFIAQEITGIQFGSKPDYFGWTRKVQRTQSLPPSYFCRSAPALT
jgi:branched-chain amino acid aminotransferase